MSWRVSTTRRCCSNFGQMGPCRRHRIEDVVAVCVGLSRHLPDFPKCVCRNILWYGSTYAQILSRTHNTTQPHNHKHTTTKMSCCRPTLQRLWSSPSMGRPAAPLTHVAADPYGPMQGACHRVRRRCCWFACFGHQTQPIKKQRGGRGLCLRWPPINQDTQQSTQSWRQR